MPTASVLTVIEVELPNVALAPLAGAANVTATPESGLDEASVTLACNALVNDVPTVALWPAPEKRMTDCGAVVFGGGPNSEYSCCTSVVVRA